MSDLLEQIKSPNDIKKINPRDYERLAREIRRFLVRSISRTGGHLASNLGVVELTMALHLCCTFPEDKIIWDVGHQCYTHKLLTGRKDGFETLRQYGGMSGFPKRCESVCDVVDTGHSSTSIGIAMGLAKARDLQGKKEKIIAVIGDGALSGGMAFEALNNAARLKSNLIIILNDNQMSISQNVGGMSKYLGDIRTNTSYTGLKEDVEKALKRMPHIGTMLTDRIRNMKDVVKRMFIPGMLFEDMGLTYIGPIDGHDTKQMVNAVENASKLNKAVIIHVNTQKGKGYPPAQKDPSSFHGVAPFYIKDGTVKNGKDTAKTYTEVFRDALLKEAKENEKITAVCAAMPSGTGLTEFAQTYPERFFDVGIAEEHAVTFAAGMAAGGLKPVVAIYSTFLQRAYDQMIHDVCINNLPVTFAIDRAGLVGSDGETHQGIFDLAYMMQMPNMTVMAPMNDKELEQMLHLALSLDTPAAIRYPRGSARLASQGETAPVAYGKSQWLYKESEIVILAVGTMAETALEVREYLKDVAISVSVVNVRFVKPFDEAMFDEIAKNHRLVITLEDGIKTGGFGQKVADYYAENEKIHVVTIGLPDKFIEHGSIQKLRKAYGLDVRGIIKQIKEWL